MSTHYVKVYIGKLGDITLSPDEARYGHEYRSFSSEFEARMMAAGCGGQYGLVDLDMRSALGIDHIFRVVTDYGTKE